MAGLYAAAIDMVADLRGDLLSTEFLIRCVASGGIATLLYILFGLLVHHLYFRHVNRQVFDWRNLDSDFSLALTSLAFGSPLLQVFGVLHEKYGISKMYFGIETHGWGYWALSIPLYLLCWDAVFYCTHHILHTDLVYRYSHFRHHAFRPPCAWSGIAIDCIENIFSGLLPYLVPLFMFPFHVYTVYAVNIMLVGWALLLHSSCHFRWPGAIGWLMIEPRDHNLHHSSGRTNRNYAAIFTLWDRMFGTLNRKGDPYWWASDVAYHAAEASKQQTPQTMPLFRRAANAFGTYVLGHASALTATAAPVRTEADIVRGGRRRKDE